MQFFVLGLAALAVYLLPAHAYVYSTEELCTTKYGHSSVIVKTTSYALTIPITFTHRLTITPTTTITPPPQTTTATTTSTATAVFTTTSTSTETDTTFVTSTSTTTTVFTTGTIVTTTSTTSVDTYTVPTPAGFTPLALEAGYVPKKRSAEVIAARAPAIRGRQVEERTPKNALCPPAHKPSSWHQYPQTVVCGALVLVETTSTKTITAKSTISTTLPVSTITTTSTVSTTVTSTTAAVPATTTTTITITTSTTTTASTTTTTTATQTVTATQASSTVYAACSSNNVVNSANGGQGIDTAVGTSTTNQVSISDPVACCENCQQEVGCLGYAQYPGEAQCYYFTNGQCDGSQTFGNSFQTNSGLSPSSGYTIGNGPCGQLGNGGSNG